MTSKEYEIQKSALINSRNVGKGFEEIYTDCYFERMDFKILQMLFVPASRQLK